MNPNIANRGLRFKAGGIVTWRWQKKTGGNDGKPRAVTVIRPLAEAARRAGPRSIKLPSPDAGEAYRAAEGRGWAGQGATGQEESGALWLEYDSRRDRVGPGRV